MAKKPVSKAKQAELDAKAAVKAEKQRKKNSDDPRDWGTLRQIRQAYRITKENDPKLNLMLAGAFVVPFIIILVIGFLLDRPIMFAISGVLVGLIAALLVLTQRTKRATYTRFEGQAGSAEVALGMLGKKWVSNPAIHANRHMDVVHRTVGPGGIVLIGEGDPNRAKQMVEAEARKHRSVVHDAPVVTLMMGNKDGQVPLDQLAKHIKKLPKKLDTNGITEIRQRLRALDAVRPKLPVPKGPMPTSPRAAKGSRRALRGG
ncbi:DUF4191 domain-containing protein [Enemella sp. A6]|uniref:DUF4191 domain-containing protein n=1 Tax=Enemella sp. A6 TaxID=3440152 RepID=UPI003EB9A86D